MVDQIRAKGGVLLGALVSSALAAATLTGAPTANATCASFFGIGNSAQCSSTLTSVAIAIGSGAEAHADGLFGTAFAVGTSAKAYVSSSGTFSAATALGDGTNSQVGLGVLAAAFSVAGGSAMAGEGVADVALNLFTASSSHAYAFGYGNLAVSSLGGSSSAKAQGVGNVAVTAGLGVVDAEGTFNNATNLFGYSSVTAGGPNALGNWAFAAFNTGTNPNTVIAGPGPLAIAGSIFQTGATIKKINPGFNINNNVIIGGAAAVRIPKTSAPTATAVRTGNKTAAPAAATHTRTQNTAPAATATSRGKR